MTDEPGDSLGTYLRTGAGEPERRQGPRLRRPRAAGEPQVNEKRQKYAESLAAGWPGRYLARVRSGLPGLAGSGEKTMVLQERQAAADAVIELPEPWRSAAVTVVLPTYNEAANLPVITAALFALPLSGLRILVADDNSPDGTGELADQLAGQYGPDRMTIVHRPGKQGLGRAYVDGMTQAVAAGAQYVVQMDADLSHEPDYLPQMLGTLLSSGADVVIGSRYVAGASLAAEWSWRRKALSAFANGYVRAMLRLGIRDVTAGFKIWRSSALEAIDVASIRSNGYSFQVEMNYRSVRRGLKIVELPIHFADRREGDSKMDVRVQLESALMPFQLRRRTR
jgi:dolichol-phosphate mannosyltransferase